MIPQFVLVRHPHTPTGVEVKIINKSRGDFDFSEYTCLGIPSGTSAVEEWVPTKELHLYSNGPTQYQWSSLVNPDSPLVQR